MRILDIWGGQIGPRYGQKVSWDSVDVFRPGCHISQGGWRSDNIACMSRICVKEACLKMFGGSTI